LSGEVFSRITIPGCFVHERLPPVDVVLLPGVLEQVSNILSPCDCYNRTMNVERMPNLAVPDFGSLDDPGHPVLSLDWSADGPHRVGAHSHPRAQIIYQITGVYRVVTDLGSWVVPPRQAIWIPSMVYHEAYTNYAAGAQMFFIDKEYTRALPKACMVVAVSRLLSELFARTIRYGNDYGASSRESRLVDVLLDELGTLAPSPLHLPLAADKRLRRVMDILLANPADSRSIGELAACTGASARTIARLFRAEVGMTFIEWRRQLRLLEAIDRLGSGQPVTNVALDLGYRSLSAFIAMFRKAVGASPTKYLEMRD
jgi:AraC-like DNA-binding protein